MNRAAPYQLLPPISEQEFARLKQDIAAKGVLIPIEQDERGNLLDGHHRMRAVQELRGAGVNVPDPPVIVRVGLSEFEKRAHVRAINLHRRHLTAAQRRAVIEDQLREVPGRSDRAIAHDLAVSPTTVGMVRRRLGERGETVQTGQSARTGRDGRTRRMPVVRAILAADGRQARRAVEALSVVPTSALPKGVLTAADADVAARIVRRESAREARVARLRDPGELRRLGRGRYPVLYVDPPWAYTGASDPGRTAERHYPTMTHEELLQLPVGAVAAKSAVLFVWAPPPKLAEAVELIDAWGFEFKTSAVWDKEIAGMGSWYRQQHELLLVATRGDMPPPAPPVRPRSVIRDPRAQHSSKPGVARQQIETMYPDVPRIELFARGLVPGWDVWGFEAEESAPEPRRRKPA